MKSSVNRKETKIIQVSKDKPVTVQLNIFLDNLPKNDNHWLIFCEESVRLLADPALLLENEKNDTIFGVTGAGKVNSNNLEMEAFDARKGDIAMTTENVESLGQGILIVHSSVFKKGLRFDEKFNDYYMVDFSLQCRKSSLHLSLLPLRCEFRAPALPTQMILRSHRSLREKYPDLLPLGTWDGPVTANPGKDLRAHSKLKDRRINDFVIKSEQLLAAKKETIEPLQIVKSANGEALDQLEKEIVWIFGTPRSGTTWLATEILNRDKVGIMNEPLIGSHIGLLRQDIMQYYQMANGREDPVFERFVDIYQDGDSRFFATKYQGVWLNSLRSMILERIAAQFDPQKYECIVIKAPNESHAADIIMKALPNSKLIFLVRDGRDVIDSKSGAFHNPTIKKRPNTPEERKYRVTYHSTLWNLHVSITNKAYETHNPNLRLFLKYEDLRFDSVTQIGKVYRFLGIKATEEQVRKIAEETKFENVPEEERGEDKNIRKASPGAWRESFNKAETALMNKIMGENLLKFGYKL